MMGEMSRVEESDVVDGKGIQVQAQRGEGDEMGEKSQMKPTGRT
jgi:hypothetical protein